MTRDVKLKFIFKFPFSFPRTRAGYKCTNFVPKTWNKVHSTNLAFRKYFLSVIDLLSLFWVQYSADHTLTISWLTRLSREDILEQKLSRYNAEFAVFLSIFMNIFFPTNNYYRAKIISGQLQVQSFKTGWKLLGLLTFYEIFCLVWLITKSLLESNN